MTKHLIITILMLTLISCGSAQGRLISAVKTKDFSSIDRELNEGAEVNSFYGEKLAIHTAVNDAFPYTKDSTFERLKSKLSKEKILEKDKKNIEEIKKLVDYLLGKGADINLKNKDSETALTLVSRRKRYLPLVKYLLDRGADPNVGNPPLHNSSSVEIANLLLKSGADKNKVYEGANPVISFVQMGDVDLLKFLIRKGSDVNYEYSGDNPNSKGFSPLHFSTDQDPKIIEALLSARAKIKTDASGKYPGDYISVNNPSNPMQGDNGIRMYYHIILKGSHKQKYSEILKDNQSEKTTFYLSPKGTPPSKFKCKKIYSWLSYAEHEKNEDLVKLLKKLGVRKQSKDGKIITGNCGY